ncbi:MAG: hypothetical protein WBD31_26865, partial [Rubripirellula sp.]
MQTVLSVLKDVGYANVRPARAYRNYVNGFAGAPAVHLFANPLFVVAVQTIGGLVRQRLLGFVWLGTDSFLVEDLLRVEEDGRQVSFSTRRNLLPILTTMKPVQTVHRSERRLGY